MTNSTDHRPHTQALVRMTLLCACLATALWLWSCWCLFPGRAWNDVRLAPIFGLKLGLPLYGGVHGLASTWMYGPLPVLLLWPATWAGTAAQALVVAGTLNLCFTLSAIALVCAAWPGSSAPGAVSASTRVLAVALAVGLWPGAAWQYLQADNTAIAVGLLSTLALVAVPNRLGRWAAAALGAAAVCCKQTALGVPLAQLVWLAATAGPAVAGWHALRLAVSGAIWLGVLLLGQNPADAWFNLVLVPAGLPWTDMPWQRLWDLGPHLAVQFGLPVVLWFWLRRTQYGVGLQLPMLLWLCSLPFGVAGLMKIGGSLNNLQGFPLWLPPALVVLGQAVETTWGRRRSLACASLLVVGIALWRILLLPAPVFTPMVELSQQGEQLARAAPGRIWFPWNPLITVYAEHRLYHVEDGLYVRQISGRVVSTEDLHRGLPPQLSFVALTQRSTDWGLALSLLPPPPQAHDVGYWRLYSALPKPAAR